MADFLTIDTLDLNTIEDLFLLLGAKFGSVSHLCDHKELSVSTLLQSSCRPRAVGLTVAVTAFRNTAFQRHARVFKTLDIVRWACWPSFFDSRTPRIRAKEVTDLVRAVEFSLEIDQRE